MTAAVARSEFGVPNLAPWTETKGHQQIVMTRPLWQKDDCGMALVVLRPGRRVEMKA